MYALNARWLSYCTALLSTPPKLKVFFRGGSSWSICSQSSSLSKQASVCLDSACEPSNSRAGFSQPPTSRFSTSNVRHPTACAFLCTCLQETQKLSSVRSNTEMFVHPKYCVRWVMLLHGHVSTPWSKFCTLLCSALNRQILWQRKCQEWKDLWWTFTCFVCSPACSALRKGYRTAIYWDISTKTKEHHCSLLGKNSSASLDSEVLFCVLGSMLVVPHCLQ